MQLLRQASLLVMPRSTKIMLIKRRPPKRKLKLNLMKQRKQRSKLINLMTMQLKQARLQMLLQVKKLLLVLR